MKNINFIKFVNSLNVLAVCFVLLIFAGCTQAQAGKDNLRCVKPVSARVDGAGRAQPFQADVANGAKAHRAKQSLIAQAGKDNFSLNKTIKFAQISDTHLSDKTSNTSYKLLASSRALLSDELKQINMTPGIDFVFATGDMTDRPKEDLILEFINGMNKLKAPWYCAFGNHDISITGDMTKKKYVSILRKHNPNFKFENSYYSFVPKAGFRVIALDAIIDNTITANGKMPHAELCWLDKELAKAQKNGEIPLMFLHHPLHEPFSSFHHKILNSEEFEAVLKKYDMPMAIFSGHYHSTKIFKEGKILHVSTPSLVSYPNAFRIITVTDTKDKVVFHFDFNETNLKDVQKKAKLLTFSSKNYEGEESDRNTTIMVEK